jgi:hypothetical protein
MITSEVKEKKLLIADRCDRCGSQAFVLVKGVNGELYFCGHHYQKHEKSLESYAFEIIDERWSINEKSQSST